MKSGLTIYVLSVCSDWCLKQGDLYVQTGVLNKAICCSKWCLKQGNLLFRLVS